MSVAGAATLRFAADHPTAAGHFPGAPMIPGALLLDEVIAAIAGAAPVTIVSAKFLHPVRPGESLALSWREHARGIAFELQGAGGVLAATGLLAIGAP